MYFSTRVFSLFLCFFSFNIATHAQFPGCPDVEAGPNQSLTCNQGCVTLTATPFEAGTTTSYEVQSIPHTPPIAYNEPGGNPISVGVDDVWSPIIDLPFTFCFYGQSYTTCKVGSNGAIQFGPTTPGGFHPWSFNASVPSAPLVNAGHVFGIYHDIDPAVFVQDGGLVQWYLLGTAPCRIFVVSFYDIAHFSCTSLRSTHMMVLYETTNTIDVYVQEKETCNSWNSGNAVIGIQNPAGTNGITPPGRNTGPWTVSSPEAWRFSPNGPSLITNFEWQVNGQFLTNNLSVEVCPPSTTTYKAFTTYTSCSGDVVIVEDSVTVSPSPDAPVLNVVDSDVPTCGNNNGSITVAASGGVPGYQYSIDDGVTYQASGVFSGLSPGTYNLTVLDDNGCIGGVTVPLNPPDPLNVSVNSQENVSCFGESDGEIALNITGGTQPYAITYNGTSNGADPIIDNIPANNYTIVVTDANGCTDEVNTFITQPALVPASISYPESPLCAYESASPTITGILDGTFSAPSGLSIVASGAGAGDISGPDSDAGTYTVTYTYTYANGCQYDTTATVVIYPPVAINAGADILICDGDSYTFNATGGVTYNWQNGVTNGEVITPSLGTNVYTVDAVDANGCEGSDQVTVTVSAYPIVSFTADTTSGFPVLQVTFENTTTPPGATDFVWNFGGFILEANTPFVLFPFEDPGTYTVILTGNLNGCESSANGEIIVFPFEPPTIVPPNVFSPNNDGANDLWQFITLKLVREMDFIIVNRWGNLVFESTDLNPTWDGKDQNGNDVADGVYFYKYVVVGFDENTYEGHGNITVVRE